MKNYGPSFQHTGGAVVVTLIFWYLFLVMFQAGSYGAFYGAFGASTWFLGREIEQINPHWGWKSWRIHATTEEKQRAARQALWPMAISHAVAIAVLINEKAVSWLYRSAL